MVAFTQNIPNLADAPAAKTGFKVITIPDLRWSRVDIKTVQLLYPSMGKMAAKKAGVDDSWFTDEDGAVTEGTSNNAYIVKGNRIITRALGNDILHGITRAAVLRFAAEAQFEVEERPFTAAEAQGADEAFQYRGVDLRDAGGGGGWEAGRVRQAGAGGDPAAGDLSGRDAEGGDLRCPRWTNAAFPLGSRACDFLLGVS